MIVKYGELVEGGNEQGIHRKVQSRLKNNASVCVIAMLSGYIVDRRAASAISGRLQAISGVATAIGCDTGLRTYSMISDSPIGFFTVHHTTHGITQ
jgi:hypothetical protein